MKLITKDTDYALRALVGIALSAKPVVSVTDLVEQSGASRAFLRKVLQRLTKHNVLISIKGNQGGFSLSCPPGKIRVVDVIRIFQGPMRFQQCFLGTKCCPDRRSCRLRRKVQEIETYALSIFQTTTLQDLIG